MLFGSDDGQSADLDLPDLTLSVDKIWVPQTHANKTALAELQLSD